MLVLPMHAWKTKARFIESIKMNYVPESAFNHSDADDMKCEFTLKPRSQFGIHVFSYSIHFIDTVLPKIDVNQAS